jgi:hypothetical protein
VLELLALMLLFVKEKLYIDLQEYLVPNTHPRGDVASGLSTEFCAR